LKSCCQLILDVEPLHIDLHPLLKGTGVFSVCCASVTKVTRSRTNSEADTL